MVKKYKKSRMNKLTIRKKLHKMLDEKTPEEIQEYIENNMTEEESEVFYEINRERHLNKLYESLDIKKEDVKDSKKKVLKFNPKSNKLDLHSKLYRKHKGKYKFTTLMNEYHDKIFSKGLIVGIMYGKKFFAEDLQNNRFEIDALKTMNSEDIESYLEEDRKEI